MAQIVLQVPDAIAQRVLDGFCSAEGYTGLDPAGAAETKAAFVKRRLAEYVRQRVMHAEVLVAANAARAAAQQRADTDISIS